MRTIVILFILLLMLPTASAHIPYIAGPETSARNPIEIEDIHLSQVWYFEQETSDSDVWLFFRTETSDKLFIHLRIFGAPLFKVEFGPPDRIKPFGLSSFKSLWLTLL